MRRANLIRIAVLAAAFWVRPDAASAQLAAQPIVTVPVIDASVDGLLGFVQDPVFHDTFYLVQRHGLIRVLQGGILLETHFLDLRGQVSTGGERGLLGMAFSPDVESGRVFVHFTNPAGDIVIARFEREIGSPHVAIPESRKDLVWPDTQSFIEHSMSSTHNGGNLAFGPDGFLYIGLGDGGGASGDDAFGNAQNPATLLGKMLRIDVNVPDDDPRGYRVPTANPFVPFAGQVPDLQTEIWAFGLRNPWRYSFDNETLGGTGALIIGDVGQSAREEINYEPRGSGGRNYGWPVREGAIANPGGVNKPMVPLPPVHPLIDYPRAIGGSITGGYVYRGSALPPQFHGRYFVADFVSGLVASVGLAVNPETQEATFADALDHSAALGGDRFRIVSFAEDASGELYIVRLRGSVHKIVAAPALLPSAPAGFTGDAAGSTVHLSWQPPSGVIPTSYQLEVGAAAGASDVLVTTLPGNATSLDAPGVADGRYFVRLRGVNEVGLGPPSTEVELVVGCTAAPATPAFLNQSVNGQTVTLQWGASAGATGYVLEAGSEHEAADLLIAPLGPATDLTVSAPEGTFFVRVRGQNACGVSAASPQVTVVVQ